MNNNESISALKALGGESSVPGEVNTGQPRADSIHNLSVRNPNMPSWLSVLMGTYRIPFYNNPKPRPRKTFEGVHGEGQPDVVDVGEDPEVKL